MGNGSGKYVVPESIRKMKPEGTTVKLLHGAYYVYEWKSYKTGKGTWGGKSGRLLGKITQDDGFIPNSSKASLNSVTTVEYGSYAIALKSASAVYERLRRHISPEQSRKLISLACIYAVNGYVALRNIGKIFRKSVLPLMFPDVRLSERSARDLLEVFGVSQAGVAEFRKELIDEGKTFAVDGRVIGSESERNQLSEPGYKTLETGQNMYNILTLLDIATGMPVATMVFEGASTDCKSIIEFLNCYPLKDKVLLFDSGFPTDELKKLLSAMGTTYISPVRASSVERKSFAGAACKKKSFLYHTGKGTRACEVTVDYQCRTVGDGSGGRRIIRYLNHSENEQICSQYLSQLEKGVEGYTREGYLRARKDAGVIFLETDTGFLPDMVYRKYKERWNIETLNRGEKCLRGFVSFEQQSRPVIQGLSFLMQLTDMIVRGVSDVACDKLPGYGYGDCFLTGSMVFSNKAGGMWRLANLFPEERKVFDAFGIGYSSSELATGWQNVTWWPGYSKKTIA